MTTEAQTVTSALAWLASIAKGKFAPSPWQDYAKTIQDMLAEPRMPAEPDETLIRSMDATPTPMGPLHMRRYHHALYARLTKPATRLVWRSSWVSKSGGETSADLTLEEALQMARQQVMLYGPCVVSITPHEVPA